MEMLCAESLHVLVYSGLMARAFWSSWLVMQPIRKALESLQQGQVVPEKRKSSTNNRLGRGPSVADNGISFGILVVILGGP